MPQRALRAVLMRGGTSRGLFFHEADLPPPGEERDRVLLEAMGSPDPGQIDGLGGATSSTSKIMIVRRSERPGCDVDYLFAQVAVDTPVVDYRGNCGNLTSAIAPFAIDEGLLGDIPDGRRAVTLANQNTEVLVEAALEVIGGRAAVKGDHHISGVLRPGSMIETRFLEPAGAVFDQLFPTDVRRDTIAFEGDAFDVSVVDVANPTIFVAAHDLGLRGDEAPSEVNGDLDLLGRLERLRGQIAASLGMVEDPADAVTVTPGLPTITMVSAPSDPAADLRVRVMSVQRLHHASPMSALMCTATAAAMDGTVVADLVGNENGLLTVEHPKGLTTATADVVHGATGPVVRSAGVTRTARRLMAGEVYVRA